MTILATVVSVVLVFDSVIGHPHRIKKFCIPSCSLSKVERRYCKHVTASASCVAQVAKRIDNLVTERDARFACGCLWEETLKDISGNLTKTKFFTSCQLLTSLSCEQYNGTNKNKIMSIMATSHQKTYKSSIRPKQLKSLRTRLKYLLKMYQRTDKLPEGREKQLSMAILVPKIIKVWELVKQAKLQNVQAHNGSQDGVFSINGHLDNSLIDRNKAQTILDSEEARIISLTSGWTFLSDKDRKKMEHEKHKDKELKLILSISLVSVVIFFIILALFAKLKSDRKDSVMLETVGDLDLGLEGDKRVTCWDTFLEKLRQHYRDKQINNKILAEERIIYPEYHIPETFISESKVQQSASKTQVKSPNTTKVDVHEEQAEPVHDCPATDSDNDEEQQIFQKKLLKNYGTNSSRSLELHVIHHN